MTAELDRAAKIALLDEYLAELDAELGPPSEEEIAAAVFHGAILTSDPDDLGALAAHAALPIALPIALARV